MIVLWLVCIVVYSVNFVAGGNILALFPLHAKSHLNTYRHLFTTLAGRGHQVVLFSLFPFDYHIKNLTNIVIKAPLKKGHSITNLSEYDGSVQRQDLLAEILFKDFAKVDEWVFEKLVETLNETNEFDLIMTELFNSDLFLGFAHKYKANIIGLSSCDVLPFRTDMLGIPDNPSYIPNSFSYQKDLTSFMNRLKNTFFNIYYKHCYEQRHVSTSNQLAKKYLGENTPPLQELAKRTSVFLLNTHHSFRKARPYPPQVIEVAGLHVKPIKTLPKDIEDFINASEHGVVLFSFGSIVQSSTMSESTRRAFCDVFSQLPQRVLWKWEEEEMPEKPENVKIVKWLPQRDVLGHPNIKLFISHGGLLGTIEAVHNAVPILGIPFFGDQMQNIAYLAQIGVAIQLDFVNITKESVSYAVKTLLNDKSFKERAVKVSEIYHDRPQSPLDTAVYWTEYVMRHKGAHHLRTAAVDLPWYQYLLLDVIFVLLLCCITVVVIIFYVVKLIYKTLCGKKQKQKIH